MIEPEESVAAGGDPSPRTRAKLPANRVTALTRNSTMAHKSVLFMAAGMLVFLCYAFNAGGLQVTLDGLFDRVSHAARTQSNPVVSSLIAVAPFVGFAVLGVLLLVLARAMYRGAKSLRKARRLALRQAITADRFVDMAAERGVGGEVAREAYRLLLPHYSHRMRARLDDDLRRDLHLSLHDSIDLYASLLRKSERRLRSLESDVQPETVLELMLAVEAAPRRPAASHPQRHRPSVHDGSFLRRAAKL